MREIEWSKDLSVGVDTIDRQHQELFKKSNDLLEAIKTEDKEKVIEVVVFLCDYSIEHFAYEEKVQLEYNYPAFQTHRDMHSNFIKKVYKFKKEIDKQGITNNLEDEVKQELINWLVNHISNIDKKLGIFLMKNSLNWSEKLNIGDEFLDKSNKSFFKKAKEFIYAINSGLGEMKVVETIEFLQNYSIQHFSEEERLQIRYNYNKYEDHRDIHSSFIKEVYEFKIYITEKGVDNILVQDVKNTILNWANTHIKKVDKELSLFIR